MTYDFFGYVLPASVTSVGEAREAIRRMQRAYLEDPASPSRALFQELQTREEAIFALRQVSLWARNFPRWCANVVQRCPFLEVRQKVIRDMYDEVDPFRASPYGDPLLVSRRERGA